MTDAPTSRRHFLKTSTGLAASGALLPSLLAGRNILGANERPGAGCIGNGGMGKGDLNAISRLAEILAVCDVDRSHAEAVSEGGKRTVFDDYRKLLERKDIDVVTISTPDHWHTKIAIDALKAGKDVHCQKPLTLTIDEGKKILQVLKETKRVFQVGTQQRSSDGFQKAVAICRTGRLGKLKKATAAIGGGPRGGPFKKGEPPAGLNWDFWLGQCPKVDYIKERCHGSFRWWYEYSGGKMTDWGAHHVDIATWGLSLEETGPVSVEPVSSKHPVEFKNGMPAVDDCYNTANEFVVKCTYAGGLEIIIRNDTENGIEFEGEKGKIFVSRGRLAGEAVDQLKSEPIPAETMTGLRKGKPAKGHMDNFVMCVKDRSTPISDVASHHRALTTCHLANIAIRLGRALKWDPAKEEIVGDAEANRFIAREQRKGFEITA